MHRVLRNAYLRIVIFKRRERAVLFREKRPVPRKEIRRTAAQLHAAGVSDLSCIFFCGKLRYFIACRVENAKRFFGAERAVFKGDFVYGNSRGAILALFSRRRAGILVKPALDENPRSF